MFTPRTQPVELYEEPYVWDVQSIWQCTWYCYYRSLEVGFSAPCWWDRETKTGSYTNAKDWLKNYREPWQVKGLDYTPVKGDILVYDGEYGHVIFCETDTMTSEYRNGDSNSFQNAKVGDYKGTLLGYLHYPYESVLPVERDTSKNQVYCDDESLRIRTEPNLNGEIVGHVSKGYYNVMETKEADGYTWYEISKDRWCANVNTQYYPVEDDFVKQFEDFLNNTKAKIKALEDENNEVKEDMKTISNITERWL